MMKTQHHKRWLIGLLSLLPVSAIAAEAIELPLSPQSWQQESFVGQTRYELREIDGKQALCGDADASASALVIERKIDLKKTPVLKWRWKVTQALPSADEKRKATDDFAARLYVLHSSGFWKFGLRALNYVWSTNAPVGQAWDNPFAGKRAQMLPLRSGEPTSGWVEESRDLAADFKQFFDRDIDEIHGIAIMVDADNTKKTAGGCFSDIRFSPAAP